MSSTYSITRIITFVASLVLLSYAPKIHAQDSDYSTSSWNSGWTFGGGALFLDAGGGLPSRSLLTRGNLAPVLNANSIDPGYGAGWELTAGKQLTRDWSLEARYAQVDSFNDYRTANAVNGAGIRFKNTVLGVLGAVNANYALGYQAEYESFDLMVGRRVTDWWKITSGIRHTRFDNNLSSTFRGAGFTTLVDLAATNNLTGGQLGSELFLIQRKRFQLLVDGRAGAYNNEVTGRIFSRTNVSRTTRLRGNCASFIGETNLKGRYQLLDHVFVEAGYRVIWIDGIALATEQAIINRTPPNPMTDLDLNDHRTLQGATAQLTFLF